MRKTFFNQKGFTLIEVLLATLILAGALIALTSTWSGTLFAFKKSEKIQIITSLLKSKAAELEIKYSKLGYGEIPDSENGDFGKEFPDLVWKSQVKKLDFPDLTALIVAQNKNGADEMTLSLVKQMTDYFSKNIKEIRVTVTWAATKKKSLDFSETNYIVNYGGTLPALGGGGG